MKLKFDNDEKAAKHSERTFCGLVIIRERFVALSSLSKNLILSTAGDRLPNLIAHLFHPGLFIVLGCYFFTPGVFWLRFHYVASYFKKQNVASQLDRILLIVASCFKSVQRGKM